MHPPLTPADPAARAGGATPPLDEHDLRLVANVHPADWRNPTARGTYDLLVVGAGTAGLVTTAIAAALGARVALVERHLMGGDCLNVGCVPSKALLRAARAWHDARTAEEHFGAPAAPGTGDFGRVMERMRRIRADLSEHDGAARFRSLGADVHLGVARFTAPDRVEVGGQTLAFRRAVIATGTRPAVPPVEGLAGATPLTNETVFSLRHLPGHLVVIGAGPVGCELAQAFARFGSRVTLLDAQHRILPNDDAQAAEVVLRALERDGVRFVGGARITGVEREGEQRRVRYELGGGEHEVVGDQLLVAAGRTPNVEGLGLERAGVRAGPGGVAVDERMCTTNPHVYAIGDVAARFRFTHVADAQARMVVQNALFFGRGRAPELVVPWCTYTSPELAHVGITAQEAGGLGGAVETVTVPLSSVDRARLDGEEDGFLRVHLKHGTDRILGATLVADHAGEIISQITTAIVQGVGLEKLSSTIFPYPTRAEILRKAADARRRERLTPAIRRGFELFFRVMR